jgi:hypothetical protein
MSATVRSIVTGALRLLGITQPGRAPSAIDAETALYSLKSMLDNWSTQNLTIYQTTTRVFDLIPGESTYTLGPDGIWELERPMVMNYCYLRYAQGGGTPVDQQITILNDAQQASITAKFIHSAIPTTVYYNPEVPNATLTFWPIPTTSYQIVLWLDQPLDNFESLNDEVQFPRGYEQAIRYNLAVLLAPEYGRTADPAVLRVAAESLGNLKAINMQPRYLRCIDYGRRQGRGPSPIIDGSQF